MACNKAIDQSLKQEIRDSIKIETIFLSSIQTFGKALYGHNLLSDPIAACYIIVTIDISYDFAFCIILSCFII